MAAFLSLSLSLSPSLLLAGPRRGTAERSRFCSSLSSILRRSNLVEFSWLDILLSSRAYLYLAYESSGPFARFANCTASRRVSRGKREREKGGGRESEGKKEREKERGREGETEKETLPRSPIRDGGRSLHFGRALTPAAVESERRRRRVKKSLSPLGDPLLIYIGRLAYFVIYC